MLGKLIKNEFRATARTFGAMYLIVFIVTVLLKLVIEIQDIFQLDNVVINILSFVTITAFVLGIIGVVIGTFILIIKRFYDNMLKNEGYLSFTLPATVGQHIASKSIVSYIWVIVSAVFIFGIVIILFLGHTSLFVELRQDIIYIIKEFNKQHLWKYVIAIGAALLISAYNYIAMGYACFSVGQAWTRNRIAGALATYIIFQIITEIITLICMVIMFGGNMEAMNNAQIGEAVFQPLLIFMIVEQVVLAIICTVITHVMLSKKLNLE
ncbi:MAG: hypothetical protein HFG28_02565 [Eubacterium sp.]|jgi:hypothetical protein|nr:hypothetical protein [Eubacterium sp.]